MKSSLRTRIILSFVVIIFVTVGSFALIGRVSINQWFNNMILASGQQYAQRMAMFFGAYYTQNGSWEGVEDLLVIFRDVPEGSPFPKNPQKAKEGTEGLPGWVPVFEGRGFFPSRDDRLLLLDKDGALLYDSDPEAGSADTLISHHDAGVDIIVDDELVGSVIAASSVGILNAFQQAYLNNVNLLVLVGGLIAIFVAIILGTWQSVRIVRPVKALSEAALKLAGGDYAQRIPVARDDELGEMTRAFNRMASELERQEMLRRRTLADVAHELRTPLSVLQIDLESIEDGLLQPDAETIDQLQLEVTTLRGLVEDLRLLSLADAGELVLDFQALDINAVIQVNVKRIERSARERDIEIVMDLAAGEQLVWGDDQRLSQVLLNLLANALQFTPGGGKVRVKTEEAGGCVRVSIQDTGEGIAPDDLPHIFERLYRTDQARARKNGGSGLGLSIARSVVEAHKGKIWVESRQGEGSTFRFELPRVGAEQLDK